MPPETRSADYSMGVIVLPSENGKPPETREKIAKIIGWLGCLLAGYWTTPVPLSEIPSNILSKSGATLQSGADFEGKNALEMGSDAALVSFSGCSSLAVQHRGIGNTN